jgi:hypothetical protein
MQISNASRFQLNFTKLSQFGENRTMLSPNSITLSLYIVGNIQHPGIAWPVTACQTIFVTRKINSLLYAGKLVSLIGCMDGDWQQWLEINLHPKFYLLTSEEMREEIFRFPQT